MEPVSSRGYPLWLLVVGALGAVIGFSWSAQDYVAATALAAVSMAGLWGYYVGAARLLGLFASATIAWACAAPIAPWMAPYIERRINSNPATTQLISSIAAGGIMLVVSALLIGVISRRVLRDRPRVQAANRLFGFGVGTVQGIAGVVLVLNGILLVEPYAKQRIRAARYDNESVIARVTALRVVDIAHQTRRSAVASFVKAYNPLEQFPQFDELRRTATATHNPGKHSSTRSQSTNQPVYRKSEVRRAIESLAQDPQLRRIAQAQQPLYNRTAVSLLNHPEIAKLLEHPDLMNELTRAMDEIRSVKHPSK
jgi:uncharacterized membrane protein required for colicin V production